MTETLVFMEAPGHLRESIAANLLTEGRWKLMLGGLDVTLRLDFEQEGCTEPILTRLPADSLPLKLIQGLCSSFSETAPGSIRVEM